MQRKLQKKKKEEEKTAYGMEENICKWHNQGINFQNILTGFKLKRSPAPEAEHWITLLVTSTGCWLWSTELLHIMILCACAHVRMHTQRNRNFIKQNYSFNPLPKRYLIIMIAIAKHIRLFSIKMFHLRKRCQKIL